MEFVGNAELKKINGTNGRDDWSYHKLSYTLEDLQKMKSFLNKEGFVNVDIKTSQKGNLYMAIDTYEFDQAAKNQQQEPPQPEPNAAPDVPEFDSNDGFGKEEPIPEEGQEPPMNYENEEEEEVAF